MANDKPTSLRMGFGYEQARSAGLGGVRASRSPKQVNKNLEQNKTEREATAALVEIAEDPEWICLIKHRAAEGLTAKQISEEIYWIDRFARAKARGHSLAYRLKNHWHR